MIIRRWYPTVFFILLFGLLMGQTEKREIAFTCPPCGCPVDEEYHDKAGNCDHCGMAMMATYKGMEALERTNRPERIRKKVAILIFEGVQIIDYTGPYEVFGQAHWEVFTVADKPDMIKTAMGMQVTPHYTFDNCPEFDIVVFPGGGVSQHLDNQKVMNWVKSSVAESETALSVCNGAFFLGEAGLLDGKTATTFASLIPALQELAPKAKVVSDQRFVDNGKIVTSAGLSSGLDGSLHVVSEYLGIGRTQEIATNLEYPWDPEAGYVRAALADKYLRGARNVLRQFDGQTLRYEGNRDQWQNKYLVKTELKAKELLALVEYQLEKAENWEKVKTKGMASKWKVPVSDNETWHGGLSIEEHKEGYVVVMKIARTAAFYSATEKG